MMGNERVYIVKGTIFQQHVSHFTMYVKTRKETLLRDGRCFLFLLHGHKVTQCTCKRRCRKCNRRHHQSICDHDLDVSAQNKGSETKSPPKNDTPMTTTPTPTQRVLLRYYCKQQGHTSQQQMEVNYQSVY